MNLPHAYCQLMEERGFSLQQLGISDIALSRDDALHAIDLLRSELVPILGGDVYCKTSNGVGLAYANWSCEPTATEREHSFAERSCFEAKRYISAYPSSGSMPLFSLVLGA